MSDTDFTYDELERAINAMRLNFSMDVTSKTYKKFLQQESTKARKTLLNEYKGKKIKSHKNTSKSAVGADGKKPVSLLNSVSKGKAYLYGSDEWQIRVRNTAPHAWLVEHGHSNVKTRKGYSDIPIGTPIDPYTQKTATKTNKAKGQKKGARYGQSGGRPGKKRQIEGKEVAKGAIEMINNDFQKDAEEYINKMLEEGLSW